MGGCHSRLCILSADGRMRRFFVVHGIVQGVGYRRLVAGMALRNGISGSVRNHEDGSVEIFAEGSEANLDSFRKELYVNERHGPQVFSIEEYGEGERGFPEKAPALKGFSVEE